MTRLHAMVVACVLASGTQAFAQAKTPSPEPPPLPPPTLEVSGFAMIGLMNFTATDSFDAALDSHMGSIFGGGGRVGLPWGGLFAGVGAWQFRSDGQRVFVYDDQVFSLGVPLDVTITPIELSAGWRFRFRRAPQFRPYVSGGFSSFRYQEVSDFATAAETVDERFNGYHLAAGAEFPIQRWLGVAWELNWTSVPDAIGVAGVSERFGESNLGGTALRFKDHHWTMTAFERKVLTLVSRIPVGRVATYGDIARLAGKPGAARAVGNIMRRGDRPGLPYHRVIAAGGALGGYSSLQLKRSLLSAEGLTVTPRRVVGFAKVRWRAGEKNGRASG